MCAASMVQTMGTIRIGISGWRYTPWRGVFYPPGLVQREELAYASHAVSSIEINGSFYALQRPASYAQWHEATPEGFVFSIKGSRLITHVRRLRDIEQPLANFLASGPFELQAKLGPFVWQFPPNFKFDAGRFEAFLKLLPKDTDAAQRMARRRDDFMAGRESLKAKHPQALRHAVEIRHDSFLDPAFVQMLRHHGVALVVADTAGKWPYREDLSSDFVYLRLHGDAELYASGYSDQALDRWAQRIRSWSRGAQPKDAPLISKHQPSKLASRDVYVYFDNDVKVHAPFDARSLAAKLGVPQPQPDPDAFTIKAPRAARR